MTPNDLEKYQEYAELAGTYLKQSLLMTIFYEDAGRQPRDDGCEAVSKALRAHHLPRHMWPIPEGMGIDRVIEDLRWKTGWLSRIIADMESETRKKAEAVAPECQSEEIEEETPTAAVFRYGVAKIAAMLTMLVGDRDDHCEDAE